MEQSKKRKILIWGSVLVIASVGGFLLAKYLKKKKEEEERKKAEADAAAAAAAAAAAQSSGGGGSGSAGGGSSKSTPFKSADEIKAFQDWLDTKYPTWLNGGKLNKGSGYGTFGPSTSSAYTTYGAEWKKISDTTKKFEDAVNYLKSKGMNESSLRKFDKGFVIAWATALKSNQTTFQFGSNFYNSKDGTKTTAPFKNKDKVYMFGDSLFGYSYPAEGYQKIFFSRSEFLDKPIGTYVEPGPAGWHKIVAAGGGILGYGGSSAGETIYVRGIDIKKSAF